MPAECRTISDLYLSTVAMGRCLKAFQFLFVIFSLITALPLIYILYLFMVIFSVPTGIIFVTTGYIRVLMVIILVSNGYIPRFLYW